MRATYQTHLGFCTDGDPSQILGIGTFLHVTWSEFVLMNQIPQIWIVAPNDKHTYARECLGQFVPYSNLNFVTAKKKRDDRYFVQISLTKVFDKVESSDIVICCDYDHVVINSISSIVKNIPISVFVSSEVRSKRSVTNSALKLYGYGKRMHLLNTSFIWGNAGSLKKIGRFWIDCYYDLEPLVPKRILVECAFGLAAVRSNMNVMPCNLNIQGNLKNLCPDCIVFHYGGDTQQSLYMKKELYKRANICKSGRDLAQAVISTENFLRNNIQKIICKGNK